MLTCGKFTYAPYIRYLQISDDFNLNNLNNTFFWTNNKMMLIFSEIAAIFQLICHLNGGENKKDLALFDLALKMFNII